MGWATSLFSVRDTAVFVEQEMNEASYAPSNNEDLQSASGVVDEWDDEDGNANIDVGNQLDHQPFPMPEAMEK